MGDLGRAVRMERLDGFEPPGLALLALFLGPGDRLPVGREDELGAGIGDFDAVAAAIRDDLPEAADHAAACAANLREAERNQMTLRGILQEAAR